MGAIATRMLSAAQLKWVHLTAKPIVVPRVITFALEANSGYGGANSNSLTADLQNIVTKYGATMPSAAEITGYQNAVHDLAIILNDLKNNKQDFDLFKTTMAQLIKGRMTVVPAATQQQLVTRVGNAMHWGTTPATVGGNFNNQIFQPLNDFFESFYGRLPSTQVIKIASENKKLSAPMSVALYTNIMLN